MSGMLAGVEAARWRRLHHGGGGNSHSHGHGGFTRRSGYCLYATSHNNTLFISAADSSSSSSFSSRRYLYGSGIGMKEEEVKDETLGQMARKAKQRLEQKLMLRDDRHRHHQPKSQSSTTTTKKKRAFFWPKKLGGTRKSSDHHQHQKCAICLDSFRDIGVGENAVKLPCTHRFHSRCLLPCLHAHSDCPCCRMPIFSQSLT